LKDEDGTRSSHHTDIRNITQQQLLSPSTQTRIDVLVGTRKSCI